MAKAKTKKPVIRLSAASLLISSLDNFGLAVKAQRRKIKPTLKINPVKRNKTGAAVKPKKAKR